MKEAEIVIAVFPQADSSLKRRPALILREMPPFRDFLICGISTQIRQKVEGFDETISPDDEDFEASGLEV
jgi:mRNA interferase MazF